MKKILFISHKINRGGAQLLLKNIIQGLDKSKFDCHVWSPCEGELKAEYEQSSIPVYIKDFEVDYINRERPIQFDKATVKRIKKIIAKHKKNKKRLAIRCAGTLTTKLLNEFDFSNVELIGIFDTNPALFGRDINGYKIYPTGEMDKFKIDSVIIAHLQPEFLKKELIRKKIKTYDVFSETKVKKLGNLISYLINLAKPAIFFAKIKPDVVYANNAISFWAVIIGKLLGKKTIWAIHEGFDPKTFRAFPQSIYLSSFKFADKFIFPSHATYNYYKDLIPEHKASIIHNGIDLELIENYKTCNSQINDKKELNIPLHHKVICNVGTMEEIKGQLYFVKAALNLLNSSDNKDLTFIIVGDKNNEYSDNIKSIIAESDFKDNFRIIPVTKDAYKFFNITDIYVTSSFTETFCLANIEAMAFNKPVIATNVCGIPETIDHNVTGLLIPPTNMENHIEENINYLLKNPELMELLTQNAYQNVLKNFTIEKTLEKYEKILKS